MNSYTSVIFRDNSGPENATVKFCLLNRKSGTMSNFNICISYALTAASKMPYYTNQ